MAKTIQRKRLKKVKMTPKATDKIETVMHEFKEGKLPIGRSKKKVKNRKQAVAIALSEARKSKRKKKK